MIRLACLLILMTLFGCGLLPQKKEKTDDVYDNVRAINVDLESADIYLVSQVRKQTAVSTELKSHSAGRRCQISKEVVEGRLTIKQKEDDGVGIGSCDMKVNIYTTLMIEDLNLETSSGDVNLEEISAPNTRVVTNSGDAKVRYAMNVKLDTGSLKLKLDAGDAEVHLPETTQFSLAKDQGAGDFKSEFAISDSAGFKILVETGAGDIEIKKI